ncbi:MAG: serine hydrolase domain-containing protein [Sediminibacterium sp.]
MKIKFFLILLLITTIFCPNIKGQPITSEINKTSVDSFIDAKMKESGLIGIAAAVIVDNKVIWSNGYGYADIARKKPFTTKTIMNVGSIAKPFVGVSLMQLAEENIISLDEDINKYLPFKVVNPYFPNEKITLRNIATHSSSLADREPFYSDSLFHFNGETPKPLGDFLFNYFVKGGKYYSDSNFYNAKPGDYWEYSNIAASLAGHIVELKTGKKLNVYCKEKIFTPLGMKNSGWFLSEINRDNHAELYKYTNDTLTRVGLYEGTTYPDGGLRTSVMELTKFYIALLNGGILKNRRILQKESSDQMQTFQFTEYKKPANINLKEKNEALFWRSKKNMTLIGHGGTDFGLKTEMNSLLTNDVAVILFTNTELTNRELGMAYYAIYDYLFEFGKQFKNRKTRK